MPARNTVILILTLGGCAQIASHTPEPYRYIAWGAGLLLLAAVYAQLTRPRNRL